MKHTYDIESFWNGEWRKIVKYSSRDYCEGYLDRMKYDAPRNETRIVRDDGKVVREFDHNDEVSVGMIAGWPTPEQYERAAAVALEKATKIRERMKHDETRH